MLINIVFLYGPVRGKKHFQVVASTIYSDICSVNIMAPFYNPLWYYHDTTDSICQGFLDHA
jgi:hypothetical protein